MNIDIRNSIKNNFKNSNNNEILESIESAVSDKDEITLPGLGVFFEMLWINSNLDEKNLIISKLKKELS
jgi:small acid-soluble spore protein I (minor)